MTDTDTAPSLPRPWEPLVTVPRVARARGIDARQLRRAIRAGELRSYQIGGWPRLRESDVDRWIESRRVGGC